MGVKKIKPYRSKSDLPIESVFQKTSNWIAGNTGAAVALAVAFVLAALLVGGTALYWRSSEARARSEYALIAARLPLQGDKTAWNSLIPVLRKFIADNRNAPPTLDARLDLLKACFQTGKYPEAVKVGQEALRLAPDGSALKPLILYQLGYACEAAGKLGEAAKNWLALNKLKAPALEREADWNLGRIYQKKNQLDKAMEMYELASRAAGDYPPAPLIDQRLAHMEMKKTK